MMNPLTHLPLLSAPLAALSLMIALSSCAVDTTSPTTVGSGNLFDATIRGSRISFDPESLALPPSYDASAHRGTFTGTVVGDTTRTMVMAFTYDIDNASLPKTLTGSDVSITYTEKVGTTSTTYDCAVGGTDCAVTLTATDKHTVDGTFTANLTSPTKTLSITNGTFSVKLNR
ncbi:MAG: hypothetical protein ABI876_16925 [Bacteroidota bacterium]